MKDKIFNLLFVIIIFLIFFEGLFRKFLNTQVFVIKDLLIIIELFLLDYYFKINKKVLLFSMFLFILIMFSLFSLIINKNIVLYLLGFREYFFYIFFIPIVYKYFKNKDITKFINKLLIFAVLIDLLGLFQRIGIIDFEYLNIIKTYHQSHSSIAGEFHFTVSIFDVPERFAIFNVFMFFYSYFVFQTNKKVSFLFLSLLFFISVFISGRRVSIFLVLLFIFLDNFNIKNFRKVLSFFIVALFISLISFYVLSTISPVLTQIIFSKNLIDDAFFYLKLVFEWYINAFEVSHLFYGNFGVTSPGSNSLVEKNFNIWIEGFWDKSLYSFGIIPTISLLAIYIYFLYNVFRYYKYYKFDPFISSFFYYMLITFIWIIKSGNLLVWAPFSTLLMGIFVVKIRYYNHIKYLSKLQ